MRVVHVNYDGAATGGASIAMLRIHHAMLAGGVESTIACATLPDDEQAVLLPISLHCRVIQFLSKCAMKLVSGRVVSTGLLPSGRIRKLSSLRTDAVVVHWLQCDTLSLREISRIKSTVFWFHHDLWPIRGVTAYEWFDVPLRLGWLDRLVQWNKHRVARRMGKRLIPVCASQWVANEIRKSGMYTHDPVVIPLPLDAVFKPGVRHPGAKFRILNGARGGFEKGLKGGDRLLAALQLIPENERLDMEVVIFGGDGQDETQCGVSIHYIGRLQGEALAQAYRDADVFAFPSRQETFGQTKIEALACGTPVVAFDETACAEGIRHKENGWIADAGDIARYAEGIRYFYKAWKRGQTIRVSGDAEYSPESVAKKWIEVLKAR